MTESPKFPRHIGNWGQGTQWWHRILHRKWKCGHFMHAPWKICNITLIYCSIPKIPACYRKLGSRNSMVSSDFTPERKWKCARFAHAQWKICNITTVIYIRIGNIFASYAACYIWNKTIPKQIQNSVLFQMLLHVKQNTKTIPKRFGVVSELFWAHYRIYSHVEKYANPKTVSAFGL